MARKPRSLHPEELELWRRVAEKADPLEKPRPHPGEAAAARPEPKKPAPKPAHTKIPDFQIGQSGPGHRPDHRTGHNLAPSLADSFSAAPVHMDRKTFTRLKRGKLQAEARIDLHGMTLARAHPALTAFILRAHGQGKRLVLVITGKGRSGDDTGPIPERRGVLKHQVPHWLTTPPLSSVVLQVTPAHLKHGGSGAYYVYLRRQR